MINILAFVISSLIVAYLFTLIYVNVAPVIKDVVKAFINHEIKDLF